jgi:hypothetical protein
VSRGPSTLSLLDSARSGLSLPDRLAASSTPAFPSLSEPGGKGDDFPNIIHAGRAADAEETEVKVDVELPAVDGDGDADADNDGDDAVVLIPGLKRGVPGLDLVPQNLISSAPFPLQTQTHHHHLLLRLGRQ